MLDKVYNSLGGSVMYDGTHSISFYKYSGDLISPIGEFLCHTWKNLFLIPTSRPTISVPEVKTIYEDLENVNGSLDFSTIVPKRPVYQNREGTLGFIILRYAIKSESQAVQDTPDGNNILDNPDGNPIMDSGISEYYDFASYYSKLCEIFHGKELIMILDDDPDWYYKGRFSLESFQSANDGSGSGITIKYNLEPFKKNKKTIWDSIGQANVMFPSMTSGGISFVDNDITYSFNGSAFNPDFSKIVLNVNENASSFLNKIEYIDIEYDFENPEMEISFTGRIQKAYSFENLKYISLDEAYVSNFNGNNTCTLTIKRVRGKLLEGSSSTNSFGAPVLIEVSKRL